MNVHDYLRAGDLYYYYFFLVFNHSPPKYCLSTWCVCESPKSSHHPKKIEGGKLLISLTIYYHSLVQYTWLHHLYLNRKVLA